jgi:pyridoxine/pyridoxamine 5'-phosphate oxidase
MALQPKASRPYMPGYGLLPADQGSGLKPWSHAVARLSQAHAYWIATTRPDGRPHAVPLWGVFVAECFMFSTGAQSLKARNLAANPYVVVGAEPGDDAVVVEGEAELVTDLALRRAFAEAYAAQYSWNMDDFSEPIYSVRPSVAFAYSSAPGEFTGGSTKWTFE